jgi:hypothetical protein
MNHARRCEPAEDDLLSTPVNREVSFRGCSGTGVPMVSPRYPVVRRSADRGGCHRSIGQWDAELTSQGARVRDACARTYQRAHGRRIVMRVSGRGSPDVSTAAPCPSSRAARGPEVVAQVHDPTIPRCIVNTRPSEDVAVDVRQPRTWSCAESQCRRCSGTDRYQKP